MLMAEAILLTLGVIRLGHGIGRKPLIFCNSSVDVGMADASLLKKDNEKLLLLEDGRQRYMAHIGRPSIQGGVTPGTVKRYRTVFDKFADFARTNGIRYWQQVTKEMVGRYGKWLEDRDYHDKTQYTELTVLKQALKWMVGENLLPATSHFHLPLRKPSGTSTYCYSQDEVRAIIGRCRADEQMHWLEGVVVALAHTGLRISELAGLRWQDIDLERGTLQLTDTTRRSRKSTRQESRSTKSHRDRVLPIHRELLSILVRLPHLPDNRVFHGPNGGKIKPDTVRNILKRDVLDPLAARFPSVGGMPGIAEGRLHSFRHFFCSMSADNDVPEQMLMSWLGHRDSDMIRHYYHMRQNESLRQMGKLPVLGPLSDESSASG